MLVFAAKIKGEFWGGHLLFLFFAHWLFNSRRERSESLTLHILETAFQREHRSLEQRARGMRERLRMIVRLANKP